AERILLWRLPADASRHLLAKLLEPGPQPAAGAVHPPAHLQRIDPERFGRVVDVRPRQRALHRSAKFLRHRPQRLFEVLIFFPHSGSMMAGSQRPIRSNTATPCSPTTRATGSRAPKDRSSPRSTSRHRPPGGSSAPSSSRIATTTSTSPPRTKA